MVNVLAKKKLFLGAPVTLYNQQILPRLNYGTTVLLAGTVAEVKILEGIQSMATAVVQIMRHRISEERRKITGAQSIVFFFVQNLAKVY